MTADALIRGYQRLIAQAHQRGIKIYGATLTPASLPPERESIRAAVNESIRSSRAFDGVIDFDRALRDRRARIRSSAGTTAATTSIRATQAMRQ